MLTVEKATYKQTWAIFCMTKWDVRNCNLTKEQASQIISDLKAGKVFNPSLYNGIRQVEKIKEKPTVDFQAIYDEAMLAGKIAGENAIPNPMIVKNEGTKEQWFVSEGMCGFAWVKISPATQPFARWLKKQGHADKAYGGGYDLWCSGFGQSITRKEKWAYAVADVFKKHGIICYANSRLD